MDGIDADGVSGREGIREALVEAQTPVGPRISDSGVIGRELPAG